MGLIQNVGKFLGIDKFGKGMASATRVLTGEVGRDIETQNQDSATIQKITYALRQEKDPTKKAQLTKLAQSMLKAPVAGATEIDPGLNLTNKEILGSAANVALNVAMPGAFKGGKAAIIGKNAALGAGFGAASGLEKNRNASGVVGSTVGGAVIGAGIGVAGIAVKAAKDFVSKTTPAWIMDKAVKPALQDLRKNVKYGSDTLGKQLLNEGVKGGPKKLLEIADTKTNAFENELQGILNKPSLAKAEITRGQIAPYLKDLLEQKSGTPGMSGNVQGIKNVFDSMPEKMTIPEANIMKRRIYIELRDVAYKLDAKLGTKAGALKQIARGLKEEIVKTADKIEPGLGNIINDTNQKLSIYGRLENNIVDQLARSMRNNAFSLTDGLLLTAGAAGSTFNPDESTKPLGFLLALGAILARHNSTLLDTYAARGLKKTGDVLGGKAAQGVKNQVIRRAGFNLP